jgi:SAM-dependent methyltransferase
MGTARYLPNALRERWWRWQYGIGQTLVDYGELKDLPTLGHHHVASHNVDFREAMRDIEVRAGQEVFLDYGSGMGAVLMMAAAYPFRKIIGVEVSPELTRVAERLVQRNRARLKCQEIELVVADATQYAVPPEVSVVYFFSPFRGAVLARVFANLRASLTRTPRKLTIIFVKPDHLRRDVAGLNEWLVERRRFECYHGLECVVFETRSSATH